jgi:hypothetical protein
MNMEPVTIDADDCYVHITTSLGTGTPIWLAITDGEDPLYERLTVDDALNIVKHLLEAVQVAREARDDHKWRGLRKAYIRMEDTAESISLEGFGPLSATVDAVLVQNMAGRIIAAVREPEGRRFGAGWSDDLEKKFLCEMRREVEKLSVDGELFVRVFGPGTEAERHYMVYAKPADSDDDFAWVEWGK